MLAFSRLFEGFLSKTEGLSLAPLSVFEGILAFFKLFLDPKPGDLPGPLTPCYKIKGLF